MSYPTVATSVEFTAGVWTDISEYVIQIDINRGRQRDLDQFQASTVTYRLDNSDGRFNPLNTSSPYYPNVLPNKRIRTIATRSAVDYPRFQGYIDSWPITWKKEVSEIEVKATDGFKRLQQVHLKQPYVGEVMADSPRAYWKLDETSPTQVLTDSSGNGYNGQYVGEPFMSQADPITDDQNGAVRFAGTMPTGPYGAIGKEASIQGSGAFSIEVWFKTPLGVHIVRQWGGEGGQESILFYVAGGNLVLETGGPGGTALVTTGLSLEDGQWHHAVTVREAGGTQRIYVDGTQRVSAVRTVLDLVPVSVGLGWHHGLTTFDITLDEVALYDSALSSTRVAAHYNARNAWLNDQSGARVGKALDKANWPAADRDIDTGNTTLQSAGDLEGQTVLGHIQTVAESELGSFYISKDGKATFRERHAIYKTPYITSQATFGDTGSDLPYQDPTLEYDETEIRNDVSISRKDGSPQKASDSTSINTYGIRSYSKTGLLMSTDLVALNYAQFIRSRDKDPKLRVTSISLTPESEATLWTAYLSRELEDRVTVKGTPPGTGGAINEEAHIQGIRETIGPTPKWTANLYLSKADTEVYWLAGVAGRSNAGVTTKAGF